MDGAAKYLGSPNMLKKCTCADRSLSSAGRIALKQIQHCCNACHEIVCLPTNQVASSHHTECVIPESLKTPFSLLSAVARDSVLQRRRHRHACRWRAKTWSSP